MNYNTLDEKTRLINVHSDYKQLGVESDEKSKRVFFEFPRFVDNVDLDDLDLYVNYENANGEKGMYVIEDKESTSDYVTFSWILSRHVTLYKGVVSYIVCAKKPGNILTSIVEWNTRIATGNVSEGLETNRIVEISNPDAIEQLVRKSHTHVNKSILDKITESASGISFDGDLLISESNFNSHLPEDLPETIASRHTHSNKSVIDGFSVDSSGNLLFNGERLKVESIRIVEDFPEDPVEGEIVFVLSGYDYFFKYDSGNEQWDRVKDEDIYGNFETLEGIVDAHGTDIGNLTTAVNNLIRDSTTHGNDIGGLKLRMTSAEGKLDNLDGFSNTDNKPMFNGDELQKVTVDHFKMLETGKLYSTLITSANAMQVPIYDLASRDIFEIGFKNDDGVYFRIHEVLSSNPTVPYLQMDYNGSFDQNFTITKFIYNGGEYTSSQIDSVSGLRDAIITLSHIVNESEEACGGTGLNANRVERYCYHSDVVNTLSYGRKYYYETGTERSNIGLAYPQGSSSYNEDQQFEVYLNCQRDVSISHNATVFYNGVSPDTTTGLHKLICGVYPKTGDKYIGESKLEAST